MKVKKIYSEQPEVEIWERLLKYTYPENINKYLDRIIIANHQMN